MKIKTITCHDVYNAGAGLQAYALSTYLMKLGHDVEIIDYKPDYLSSHYSFVTIGNPIYERNIALKILYLIAKFPSRVVAYMGKRKKNYDSFKKRYLKTTSKRFSSIEELKTDIPEADVYLAGSDQIWNPIFKNGKDSAFYLEFAPQNKIKASYAASFAVDCIPTDMKESIKSRIEKLDYISVREKSGLKIIEDLGINRGCEVLDPVFLLEEKEWCSLCTSVNKNDKYILLYDFDNSENIKHIAQKMAQMLQCKIYSIFKCEYAHKTFEKGGPIEFLSLVKNAEFVISNSFHATAFSLIFEKQFIVVNRNEKINTRMQDLLSKICLEERIINDVSQLARLTNVKYEKVHVVLQREIGNSKLYIQKVLEGVRNESE